MLSKTLPSHHPALPTNLSPGLQPPLLSEHCVPPSLPPRAPTKPHSRRKTYPGSDKTSDSLAPLVQHPPPSTSSPFSVKLPPSWAAPSLFLCMGLFLLRCRAQHFPLLNFRIQGKARQSQHPVHLIAGCFPPHTLQCALQSSSAERTAPASSSAESATSSGTVPTGPMRSSAVKVGRVWGGGRADKCLALLSNHGCW